MKAHCERLDGKSLTYDEAIDCEDISPAEAYAEIAQHADDAAEARGMWQDFVAEYGERGTYSGADVLGFLGY